jgi:ubiquinone/menaquinone biosynthesis C-methylase UbiE
LQEKRKMDSTLSEHNQHYAPSNIDAAVSAALTALYNNDATLTIENLAGLDQFHTGGIQATRALAKRAAITASDHVLDVGGGLGGPARLLAQEIGCQVIVIDLTEAYCRVGEYLTAQAMLTDRVRFQQGNALDLPFEDESFDVVWTQHSSMNIPDKARLYAQIHRVLRPGGRLALQEVTTGSGEAIHLPTMWAHSETMNFLVSSDALRAALTRAGFRELAWNDISNWSLAWFQERQRAQQSASTPSNALGLQLLLGADVSAMIRNHLLNLQEGRIRIVEGVLERL